MKIKYISLIFLFLLLLVVPASAVGEWVGRQVAMYTITPDYHLVLAGGYDGGAVRNDTFMSYQTDGAVWSPVNSSSGWTIRYGGVMVPLTNNSVVLMGGNGEGSHKNDTWISGNYGATWRRTSTGLSSFTAREYATGVTMANGSILFIGGNAGGVLQNDTWISGDGGATFGRQSATAGWDARRSMNAVALADGSVVLIGGFNTSGYFKSDVWRSTDYGKTWVQMRADSAGNPPVGRIDPRVVVLSDQSIIFAAGNRNGGLLYDVWRSVDNGATWTQQSATNYWTPREGHMMWALPNDKIILAGGVGGVWLNDIWYSTTKGTSWNCYYLLSYATAGNYNWAIPGGAVYYGAPIPATIGFSMSGGGSGGAPGWNVTSLAYGGGGLAGANGNYSGLKGTSGTSYPLTVGYGGLPMLPVSLPVGASSNPGGVSSFFGKSKAGATGSVQYATGGAAQGGAGASTAFPNLQVGYIATNGTGIPSNNGIAGTGYGAGGGGGGVVFSGTWLAGTSGAGAQGIVRLWTNGSLGEPSPNFTASSQSTTIGSMITFTDYTVTPTQVGLTYDWDFGDGTTHSTTAGTLTHAYGYAGSFTVTLTVSNVNGVAQEIKESYILVTGSQSTTYMIPHTVSFTITDYSGNELDGVNVSASPQNFTAPDGWLQTYYGVAAGVTLNGTTLNGVTGYDGTWAAPMLGAYRYNITFNKTGVVPTYSMSMYPTLEGYTIRIPLVGQLVQPTPAGNYISYYLYNTSNNASAENFTIKYKDTSGGTSVLIYNVTNSSGFYKLNGSIAVAGGVGWNNVTTANVSHGAGESLTVRFSAAQSQVGYVNKSLVVTWDNLQTMSGYPSWVGQWLGIAVLVLFAGSVSMVNVKYAVVILPVLAYFLVVYTRWLAPVVGLTAFFASLGILLVLGALRYIRDQKGKLGRT